jgi:alkylation response protein AidB-like acyl-CoA dehydrogenase
MHIDLPADDDPRRLEVRRWFEAHPKPSARELVEAGYVVPHWPKPYGLDADPELQLIIADELRLAGVAKPINPIGIGHCGPILVALASEEQKERYLWPMLTAEEMWCQLFSEPGAGSDLANLSTRAVRDGDVYVVNGQKIWTSLAERAEYGILIARTNADAPKHTGISYFIIPMNLPGIEIRPIRNMTGGAGFNEVFFTDVRVPAENLIGEENRGWGMAKTTLANERVSLSSGGLQWGHGPTARDLVDLIAKRGGVDNGPLRQRLVAAFIMGEILRYHHLRMLSAAVNKRPGPDASLRKALADPHGKVVFNLAKDLMGADALLNPGDAMLAPEWQQWAGGFLFSPALTIGGGTSEVLRNIIAERLLGLPHDADVEQGKTWAETRELAATGART